MPAHYFRRQDLSKYTLKSFDSANEVMCDTNNSDQLTYNANGTSKIIADTTSAQTLTNKTLISPVISGAVTASVSATPTLTAAQSGGTFLFDRASGVTYTLPAPVVGLNYTFIVTTSITSGSAKVITDAGTTLLIGSVWETVSAGPGTQFFANGTTHIALTQNGTTTGGLINTIVTFTCISATQWLVDGTVMASGTIATPFATS